jgi:hypothetical protein
MEGSFLLDEESQISTPNLQYNILNVEPEPIRILKKHEVSFGVEKRQSYQFWP